ncbi:hypothetical protein JNB85_23375 [Rhizobium mesosinicum]|uniref:histidine kinase n=1 Tax=Rhizobium mesosinicum TaxID=335017 RepID=A0ABS7GZR6_9HYPH|nr:hypothetical protein [Rhizobium mesosinicum]
MTSTLSAATTFQRGKSTFSCVLQELDANVANGALVAGSREDDGGVKLTVADTGCGLATLETDRLFDAFHTTKPDGMGIGLSVSRSIVEAHGGKIWATPGSAGGAIFGFSIRAWRTQDSPCATKADRQ